MQPRKPNSNIVLYSLAGYGRPEEIRGDRQCPTWVQSYCCNPRGFNQTNRWCNPLERERVTLTVHWFWKPCWQHRAQTSRENFGEFPKLGQSMWLAGKGEVIEPVDVGRHCRSEWLNGEDVQVDLPVPPCLQLCVLYWRSVLSRVSCTEHQSRRSVRRNTVTTTTQTWVRWRP